MSRLRADRQGPAGGQQCSPRQQQDQADVPAEPAERDTDLGVAGAEHQAARIDARPSLSSMSEASTIGLRRPATTSSRAKAAKLKREIAKKAKSAA